jgi:hypothetical protein
MNFAFGLFLTACVAAVGFAFYQGEQFKTDIIKFESRCTGKGGLTLQAYKTGTKWFALQINV